MISIERINDRIYDKTKEFLSSVPSIENIDEIILKNACVVNQGDSLVGCISYEEFGYVGLIRYFVFKKALDIKNLNNLVRELELNALDNNLKEFICIAENDQIKDLFTSLDFKVFDSSNIYIDEERIENTKFRDSIFLRKKLN